MWAEGERRGRKKSSIPPFVQEGSVYRSDGGRKLGGEEEEGERLLCWEMGGKDGRKRRSFSLLPNPPSLLFLLPLLASPPPSL